MSGVRKLYQLTKHSIHPITPIISAQPQRNFHPVFYINKGMPEYLVFPESMDSFICFTYGIWVDINFSSITHQVLFPPPNFPCRCLCCYYSDIFSNFVRRRKSILQNISPKLEELVFSPHSREMQREGREVNDKEGSFSITTMFDIPRSRVLATQALRFSKHCSMECWCLGVGGSGRVGVRDDANLCMEMIL